uniref:RNA helicase n=1 Tax=Calcidiscus leptoporus TaxID=127549 RepID=A0A7S0J815_9EUKA|mmetsp:Transcript_42507/g.99567  ORF Transcript_42507/g.99567 Transcript_42507/m.99567 type:complete len:330 (+) Transcript_42507:354-1343(+)
MCHADYCAGALQTIDLNERATQVIILSNTRELAKQTAEAVSRLGHYMAVTSVACTGGSSARADEEKLRRGVQVVSGTPGRVLDMLRRGALRPDRVASMIVDEADEMLSGGERGFREQVYDVFQMLRSSVHVALFSATMPAEVLELSERFMREPVRILVKREAVTLDGIKQFYINVEHEHFKLDTLLDLYSKLSVTQAIIFANTRRRVEWLTQSLNEQDFTCSAMHADLTSAERHETIEAFRCGGSRILISTDVLARGIDVQQVSLVINFNLPTNKEAYIHRIGRSGRCGRKGVGINLITLDDVRALREIEQFYATQINELPSNFADHLI